MKKPSTRHLVDPELLGIINAAPGFELTLESLPEARRGFGARLAIAESDAVKTGIERRGCRYPVPRMRPKSASSCTNRENERLPRAASFTFMEVAMSSEIHTRSRRHIGSLPSAWSASSFPWTIGSRPKPDSRARWKTAMRRWRG